jgi:general stress protein 26
MKDTSNPAAGKSVNAPDPNAPNVNAAIESRDKFWKRMKAERVVMLITRFTGELHARPMAPMPREEEGAIYFLTAGGTLPPEGVEANCKVAMTVAHMGVNDYFAVYGVASRIDDREKIREFWTPASKAFFDGPDDPAAALLRVHLEEAEIWEGDPGPLAALKFGFAAITGGKPSMGEVRHVDL